MSLSLLLSLCLYFRADFEDDLKVRGSTGAGLDLGALSDSLSDEEEEADGFGLKK